MASIAVQVSATRTLAPVCDNFVLPLSACCPFVLVIRLLVGCLIRLLVWCRLGCRFRRGLGARRGIRLRLRSLPTFLRLHDDRKGLGGSGSLTVGDGDSDVIGSRSIGIHIIGGHIRRSERHVAILRVVRGHAVKRIKSVTDRNGPVTGGDDGCRVDRSGSTRPNLQRRQRMRRDGDRRVAASNVTLLSTGVTLSWFSNVFSALIAASMVCTSATRPDRSCPKFNFSVRPSARSRLTMITRRLPSSSLETKADRDVAPLPNVASSRASKSARCRRCHCRASAGHTRSASGRTQTAPRPSPCLRRLPARPE